jgi:predicted SnoaL-like aldol condensation-catalyzing enzyme
LTSYRRFTCRHKTPKSPGRGEDDLFAGGGGAVVHIFRFEGGLIVELWDVGQDVPEQSVSENGMF